MEAIRVSGWALLIAMMLATVGSASTDVAPFDGLWSGTWTRTEPAPGNGSLVLALRHGDGSIRLNGSVCLRADTPARLTADGGRVRIEVKGNGASGLFAGTIAGKTLSGTMTVSCGGLNGKGTWQATKS